MREILSKFPSLTIGALSLCLLAGVALADDDSHEKGDSIARRHDDTDEYDRIRDSVKAGKLLPLARIKAQVEDRWPGEIVDISVGREHGRISYAFRVLNAKGRLVEIEINAADGAILEVENE